MLVDSFGNCYNIAVKICPDWGSFDKNQESNSEEP
jgi:hypothetical protein